MKALNKPNVTRIYISNIVFEKKENILGKGRGKKKEMLVASIHVFSFSAMFSYSLLFRIFQGRDCQGRGQVFYLGSFSAKYSQTPL